MSLFRSSRSESWNSASSPPLTRTCWLAEPKLSPCQGLRPDPGDGAGNERWARLVIDCRYAGVHQTVRLTDALIAATAFVHVCQ